MGDLKNKSAITADPARFFFLNILLAVSYLLIGKISYYFAIPPGLITVIWPLSGISAAAVILLGYGTLPGIAAGSFILNAGYFGSSASHPHTLTAILMIAAGTALQSGLFAYFIKRKIGAFPVFPKPAELAWFLFISAAASLVSSFTGGLSIAYVNLIEQDTFLFSFLTWWAGEFLGIIVFLPLIMSAHTVITKKKSKQLLLNIIGSLGILLNLMIFLLIYQGETRHINTLFSSESKTLSNLVSINSSSLDRDLMTLVSLSESAVSQRMSESRFAPADFLAGINHLFSSENIGFIQVNETDTALYQPVFAKNSGVFRDPRSTFDLNNNPANITLLKAAEREDKTVLLTVPVSGEEKRQRYIFILVHPVKILNEREKRAEGRYFAAIFIRPEKVFLRNHKEHSFGIEHFFYEREGSDLKLIGSSALNNPPQDLTNPEFIRLNTSWHNKDWIIVNTMSSQFTSRNRTFIPWIVLFVGCLFAGLSVYYLYKRFLIMEILTKNEKDYRLLAESVSDIIWVFDYNDQKFNYISPSVLYTRGYTQEEAINSKLEDTLSPESFRRLTRLIPVRLKEIEENPEITYTDEYDQKHKNGGYVPTEVTMKFRTNEANGHLEIFGVTRDISERKKAEEKLRQNEERFRLISMAISDYLFSSIVGSDGSLHHEWVTGAFEKITGYPFSEYQAMGGWRAAIYPEDISIEEQNWNSLMNNEKVNSEIRTIKKNGDILWVRVNAIPVWNDHENRLAGIIGAVEDISDRKRIELELKKERESLNIRIDERTADLKTLNEELAKALKYKDEFLANMSHELRTPLNGILALSESLIEQVRGPLNEKQLKSVTTIQQSGRHLLDLINDILDLAKIDSGKVELSYSVINVNELCESSLLFVKEISKKKNQNLNYNITLPDMLINADGRRLKQILVNLLNNAVKFTPENGQIWLNAEHDEANSNIIFTIKDSGIGITAEGIGKLFNPFVQLDSGLTRMHEGTGLGLALVQKLITLHKGTISVSSEGEGQGSQFKVVIPVNMKATDRQEMAPGLFDSDILQKAMIIDDSPSTAHRISEYLNRFGIETFINLTGESTIELIIENKPDIVFLDLLLPDISGFEILRELKTNPKTTKIPVIIISSIDERDRGLQLGAAEYLVKPVTEKDIQRLFSRQNNIIHEEEKDLEQQNAAGLESQTELTGGNILLVEDNEINIYSMGEYLMEKGYTLTIARNGIEALKRLETMKPDLILMDIQMPVLDGIETTERIRQIPGLKDLPVFALTALAMTGDRERCMKAGVNEYISKPVELKQLIMLIEKYLSNKKEQ